MLKKPLNLTIVFLLIIMLNIVLGGCEKNGGIAEPAPDNLPIISVVALKVSTNNFDGELVARAIDDYVSPLIGAHVSLEYIETEHYRQKFSEYMATDSIPDIFPITFSMFQQLFENEQLLPLDSLLQEYGDAVMTSVGEELLGAQKYNGQIYAIANLSDRASSLCFEYRKNTADSYGLDMASAKTIEDLTAVLSLLKQKNSGVVPVSSYSFRTCMRTGNYCR